MVLAVHVTRPLNVVLERTHDDLASAATLSGAFPVAENWERLPYTAQEALLSFVRNADRNLRLWDRAIIPVELLPRPWKGEARLRRPDVPASSVA